MKRITALLIAGALGAAVLLVLPSASAGAGTVGFAQSFDSQCRPDGCRSNADPGGTVVVSTEDAPSGAVGLDCSVTFTATNNESVHSGVDLIVSSGTDSVTIPGIEDEGYQSSSAADLLTIGDTVTLTIRFGPDGISSLGGTVDFVCEPETTTTTEPDESTTTTEGGSTTSTTLPKTPPAPPTPANPDYTG